MKHTALLCLCTFFIFAQVETAVAKSKQTSWRCGRATVATGDSSSSVLMKCGPPTYKEVMETNTSGVKEPSSTDNNEKTSYEDTTLVTEEWAYNCGRGRLNMYLTFEGSKLTTIMSGEYGSGESYCKGADSNPNNN